MCAGSELSAGQAPLLLRVLIMQHARAMALWGNGSMFGNAQDIKQEWDAFQTGFLPNVCLKSTVSLNQRRKSELNRFSVLGASN